MNRQFTEEEMQMVKKYRKRYTLHTISTIRLCRFDKEMSYDYR
jgi:hypothetical protein